MISQYQWGLIALATLCVMTLLQSMSTALAFNDGAQTPGVPLSGDHQSRSFRIVRAYANATENLPAFGFSLVAAILAGANPTLVNWLAVIFVLFRIAFSAVYYAGIGIVAGGPRTMLYVGGVAANAVLATSAIYALLAS
jgi:uncharacterized MAPEG superfamily protein